MFSADQLFLACLHGDAAAVSRLLPAGRGLHSSTLQLNLSAFCVTRGAGRGYFRGV